MEYSTFFQFEFYLFLCFFKNWVTLLLLLLSWRRKWQPTPVFLPGKSHGRRSLAGYSPWGHKELDTTEWLHFFSCMSFLHIFDINTLSNIWFQILSPIPYRLFILVFLLLCRIFFVWSSPDYSFLPLELLLLVLYLGNCCQDQCEGPFYLCFLLAVLWFQVIMLRV